ncbi:TolB family protein [Nonomuraea sp. NPDC050227]|uniref:TolB family protein n=1 Tax=Nonomuraea sp. NPDC050227 TaxID=3364360 RepID=UPI0037B63486
MRSEDDLAEALRAAADRAPEPSRLLGGVAARRRRRRRRRTQGLAAATAVAAVIAAVTLTTGNGREEATRPAAAPQVVPLERAWPQAVTTMPAQGPDGWRRFPLTAFDATRVLVAAGPREDTFRLFEVYDTVTRTFRELAGLTVPPGMRTYLPQPPAFDGTNLAWYVKALRDDGTPVREIWTAPLAGGAPRRVAAMTGEHLRIERIAVNGDRIIWSEGGGGVWWMPLAGGEAPRLIPGSEGLHLIRWPWATDADDSQKVQTKVVDLSGAPYTVRVVAPRDVVTLRCGPFWCWGAQGGRSYLQRADGTGAIEPRGLGLAPRLADYPALDRFAVSDGEVYDLATGALVTFERVGIWWGDDRSAEPSTIVYWVVSGKEYRLLNLAAVPPAQ